MGDKGSFFHKAEEYNLRTLFFSNPKKQLIGEPVEKFYGCLRELSLNCDLGSHEESIIRDVFIANLQDVENQRELLKETRSAKKALEIAMNIEMG